MGLNRHNARTTVLACTVAVSVLLNAATLASAAEPADEVEAAEPVLIVKSSMSLRRGEQNFAAEYMVYDGEDGETGAWRFAEENRFHQLVRAAPLHPLPLLTWCSWLPAAGTAASREPP
jgi:hypothetical protein